MPSSGATLSASVPSCRTIYLTNIPDPRKCPSPTSAQGSTSRGQDFYEFWDSSKQDVYQRLSWLRRTGSPASGSSSSSGYALGTERLSWFSSPKVQQAQSRSLEKTSCPSFKFTVVDGTADAGTKRPTEVVKTMKLRLKPSPEQKRQLAQWSGCLRFTYNKAIALLTKPGNTHRSPISLQNRLVVASTRGTARLNSFLAGRPWLQECPSAMRKYAVREAKANLQACWTNFKRGHIARFRKPFKSKHQEQLHGWAWTMEKSNVSKKGDKLYIFKDLLGEMRYCGTKQLHKLMRGAKPDTDCKIQRTATGEYYLVLGVKVPVPAQPEQAVRPVSLDVGVRKYVTSYDMHGSATLYGNRWSERVMALLVELDKLQSLLATTHGNKVRMKLKRRSVRLRRKVANLKHELMCQVANDLTKSHDCLLIGKLDVKDLTLSSTCTLTTKTVRALWNAGHGKFLSHLRWKCLERGAHFMVATEHYTSQTCPECGALSKCDEVFRCRRCGFKHDRDVVGALNILLRATRTEAPV